jgi:hypothetical protein
VKTIDVKMTDAKMIRRPWRIRSRSLTVVRLVLCLFALLPSAIAQNHPDASANTAAQKTSQQKSSQTNAAADATCKPPPPLPLECPPPTNAISSSKLIAPQQPAASANPRTVRLTWNANPTTHDLGTNAVGYCLYRATSEKISKTILDCKDCELVTKVPEPGLGCIDKATQAGKIYFYVVAAINQCGHISAASNEAKAEIDKPSPRPPSEKPLPPCR